MATISADIYFDSVNGDDAWDGTTANFVSGTTGPKKSIGFFSHANNHLVNAGVTIYLANGSEWNVTDEIGSEQRLHYRDSGATAANPVTVTNYTPSSGATARPIVHNYTDTEVADWTDIGGGDWTYTLDVSIVQIGSFIRFALLKGAAPYGDRSFLESDVFSASGTTLTVSSGANDPVTTYGGLRLCYMPVFYQQSDTSNVRGGRVYHGIDCTYAGAFVSGYNTTAGSPAVDNLIYDCDISWCGKGIVFKAGNSASNIVSFTARNNVINYCAHAGIEAEGPKVTNPFIEKNEVSFCNLSNGSNGALTVNGFGNTVTTQNGRIIGNTVSNCPHGRGDRAYDGSGIYVEEDSRGTIVEANHISLCHHAIQDNSGADCTIRGNFVDSCDIGIVQSDAGGIATVDADYSDNCFKNMTYTALEYHPAPTSPLTAIISLQSAGTFNVRNNVFQGAAGTTDDGLRVNTGVAQTRTETNNAFQVGGDEIVNTTGTPQTPDASDVISSDLKIGSDGVGLADSPLIAVGVKHWSAAWPNTTSGPKPNVDVDIGLQSARGSADVKNR